MQAFRIAQVRLPQSALCANINWCCFPDRPQIYSYRNAIIGSTLVARRAGI